MTIDTPISSALQRLTELAPAGYALGFHINFTTPRFMFQTYPKAWRNAYGRKGYLMADPVAAWGFENVGICDWAALADPKGVVAEAATFGLQFGIACASHEFDSRSIGGLARSDRPFTEQEIEEIRWLFELIHRGTHDSAALPSELQRILRQASILASQFPLLETQEPA